MRGGTTQQPAACAPSTGTLTEYLLHRMEELLKPTILGLELKRFPPQEVERAIADRLLVRIADATEVECEVSCGQNGLCHVDAAARPVRIFCPLNHVPPRLVEPHDIRQYTVSVRQFLVRLCEANGIIRDEFFDPTTFLRTAIYCAGRWNTAGRTYSVWLTCGLVPDDFEGVLDTILTCSDAKPLVLSPTFRVSSPGFQRVLRWKHARFWTLADVMTPEYVLRPLRVAPLTAFPGAKLVQAPAPKPDQSEPILVIDRAAHSVTYKGLPVELQPMQFDLLCILAEQPGKFFSRKILYDRLFKGNERYDHQITDHKRRILDAFRAQLVGKAGITRAEISVLIETKNRVGYRLCLNSDEVQLA